MPLEASYRATQLPTQTDTDAVIEEKAKKYFPRAVHHLNQHPDLPYAGSWQRFQIPAADKKTYLRNLATTFTPKVQDVVKNHWSKFLRGWKVLGLTTDPDLGVYFTRLLLEQMAGDGSLPGGAPEQVQLAPEVTPLAHHLATLVAHLPFS